jgi:uncharacterized metal-binding protein YceD (DUF177 family)
MSKHHPEPPPPHGFRRHVSVARVGEAGLKQTVEAKPAEYEKIAAYLGLAALRGLKADIALSQWRGRGLRVTGMMTADVTQACVVTLDPVDAHIEAAFERRFLPAESLSRAQEHEHDVLVDPEGEEPAEPLGHDVDLGEILIEELSLNLDPYPRKEGVEFKTDETASPRETPFAGLAKLRPKLVKKDG